MGHGDQQHKGKDGKGGKGNKGVGKQQQQQQAQAAARRHRQGKAGATGPPPKAAVRTDVDAPPLTQLANPNEGASTPRWVKISADPPSPGPSSPGRPPLTKPGRRGLAAWQAVVDGAAAAAKAKAAAQGADAVESKAMAGLPSPWTQVTPTDIPEDIAMGYPTWIPHPNRIPVLVPPTAPTSYLTLLAVKMYARDCGEVLGGLLACPFCLDAGPRMSGGPTGFVAAGGGRGEGGSTSRRRGLLAGADRQQQLPGGRGRRKRSLSERGC